MQRRLRLAALASGLIFLAGCATAVRTDFERHPDLAALRTFHVLDTALSVPDDPTLTTPFSQAALREEIRHELHKLGFRAAEAGEADFLVGFHVVYGQRVAALDGAAGSAARSGFERVGHGYRGRRGGYGRFGGFGRYGGFGRFGYGGGGLGPRVVSEGTLVIDIIDRRAERLAWRGWSHRRITARRPDPDRIVDALGALVPEILAAFPPDQATAAPARSVPERRI